MKRRVRIRFREVFASLVFLAVATSCAEAPIEGGSASAGGGHTLTLTASVDVAAIPETKATVRAAAAGSEAAKAGFSYELVTTDLIPSRDTTATPPLATKAPTTLKNAYALLFTSAGAFNGRASLGTVTAGVATDITFSNVATTDASNCRLVIVANDNAATNAYASSGGTGGFAGFTGTYAAFQALTMTQTLATDADIPYAGTATITIASGETGTVVAVSLYRTLSKITLSNTFSITGGPARSSVTLCNAGERRFAPSGANSYDGTGSAAPTSVVTTTADTNAVTNTWFVGENIRPAGTGITSVFDRNGKNAPANACYIRIASAAQSINKTTPSIGEEYLVGSQSFTYDIYLGTSSDVTDFSLRRHTNYTITSSVSGTLADQQELAAIDGRVTLTTIGGAGLCIGRFGGASGYTTGTGAAPTITGSYTKMLLLQPNTSGSTAPDTESRKWSENTTTQMQSEMRKYWDRTYTLNNIDKTSGLAYDYCYQLTLGGVAKGTWYLPTQSQLMAIWVVLKGLQGGAFARYGSFGAYSCWSSTEDGAFGAWFVYFNSGNTDTNSKADTSQVRCVRDL